MARQTVVDAKLRPSPRSRPCVPRFRIEGLGFRVQDSGLIGCPPNPKLLIETMYSVGSDSEYCPHSAMVLYYIENTACQAVRGYHQRGISAGRGKGLCL